MAAIQLFGPETPDKHVTKANLVSGAAHINLKSYYALRELNCFLSFVPATELSARKMLVSLK